MIKIMKGSRTLTIPSGAYESMYAPCGWEVVGTKKKTEKKSKKEFESEPEVEVTEESEESEEAETEEDVEYVDPEELLEKPIEELDFEELKIVADYLDINTKGLKTKKEVREAIKASRK